MIEKIKAIVDKYPNRVACINGINSITYKELWDTSIYYSNLLKKEGTTPVVIYGHKEIEMIISILSCILSNRTYIPIEYGTPEYRIKEIMKISKSRLLLSNNKLKNINSIKLKELKKYKNEPEKKNKNDIVYIIFTSGSTGLPKGVPISYDNLDNFVNWISKDNILSKYDGIHVLNNASFSFDLSVTDVYYSLCNGHTLVMYDFRINEDYNKYFNIFKKNKIKLTVMTPTVMKLCLLNKDFNHDNYPDFECVYFCGEELDKHTIEKLFDAFPKINILNAYGPSEATSAVCLVKINKKMLKEDFIPVGDISKSAVEIKIKSNEIILKGKSVFDGYLSLESENCYNENGINCYKTGDKGYIEDNLLYFKGRKDNQIKYKGYRIELEEIEKNIKNLKKVSDCKVVSVKNESGVVSSIKAYVITDLDEDRIKSELFKRIPSYMIPKTIIRMDEFPINKNGKIDRKELSRI